MMAVTRKAIGTDRVSHSYIPEESTVLVRVVLNGQQSAIAGCDAPRRSDDELHRVVRVQSRVRSAPSGVGPGLQLGRAASRDNRVVTPLVRSTRVIRVRTLRLYDRF